MEHTTSVYSGILRMADLLALQPNMDIRLHIVASDSRREKVFTEIRRPVFSLLDRGPLAESCTYIPYEAIRELSEQKLLAHLSTACWTRWRRRRSRIVRPQGEVDTFPFAHGGFSPFVMTKWLHHLHLSAPSGDGPCAFRLPPVHVVNNMGSLAVWNR